MKSHVMNQSQLTEHVQQLYFDLFDLVRFSQLSDLLVEVLSHVTIPFDANEILFQSPIQYKSHRKRRTEETRDE